MARDEFMRDIRRAVSFLSPRVEVDNKITDAGYIENVLKGLDLWISPKNVEAYKPGDFADLPHQDQKELDEAVSAFLKVAKTVDPKAPTTKKQRDDATPHFVKIVRIVQRLYRDDWLQASAALVSQAEIWAKEAGWPTKRYPKEVAEDTIGTYKVERLLFSVDAVQLALVPVGRFAPGTDGMFELAVLPAYDSVMVVRDKTTWYIHPLPDETDGKRVEWSKDSFVQKSIALSRLP